MPEGFFGRSLLFTESEAGLTWQGRVDPSISVSLDDDDNSSDDKGQVQVFSKLPGEATSASTLSAPS